MGKSPFPGHDRRTEVRKPLICCSALSGDGKGNSRFFEEVVKRTSLREDRLLPEKASGDLLQEIAKALPGERRQIVCAYVHNEVRQVLGMPAGAIIDRRAGLMELGMDSLMGVQLRNRIRRTLGPSRKVPASVVFNYPSIESMAEFLLSLVPIPPDKCESTLAAEKIPAPADTHAAIARELESFEKSLRRAV